jgi:AcrR family transcriptional regulator
MAPKFKVTKDQVLDSAMKIANESGLEAITARELANRLGVSSRPIYSVYASMEDLKREVVKKVFALFAAEMVKDNGIGDPFMRGGLNYINFAKKFPQLYRINNVTGHKYHGKEEEAIYNQMVETVRAQTCYSEFSHEEMTMLFTKMWIFSHGLADLISQGTIPEFTDEFALRVMKETGEAVIRFQLMLKKGEVQTRVCSPDHVIKKMI